MSSETSPGAGVFVSPLSRVAGTHMSSTSRSSSPFHSSPATPESGQDNDFMGDPAVAVAGWDSTGGAQTLSEIVDWVSKDVFGSQQHSQSDMLLSLDDIIQEDAFAECVYSYSLLTNSLLMRFTKAVRRRQPHSAAGRTAEWLVCVLASVAARPTLAGPSRTGRA